MAIKSSLLFLSVSLLVLGCFARQQVSFQNECQIDRLNAREADDKIKSEAGMLEIWNPNHDQFRCAGVTIARKTIERNGLALPEFSNAPQLAFVVQGRGYGGIVVPGCAETFQEGQQQGQQSRGIQDQHQKIRQFREGDVLAIPAGVAHWAYNDGDQPLVLVKLLDTSNFQNQLDQSPRSFFLAGNPKEEHQKLQQYMQQGLHGQEQSPRTTREQCSNIFCGFDARLLAEAFNVDESTARRLQSENDKRGNIVKVKAEDLQVIRPPRIGEEEQEYRHRRSSEYDNGIEETLCTMRLQENIGDPARADIYSPQVGRISTLNSHKLPVLSWIRLSAERGVLYRNGMMVPHWNQNAHSIMYAIRGSARIQIVNNFGQTVFDDRVRKGQVLTVPQNYAVVKRAESEGFEWISFKTNDNAMITPLSGKTSAIRAIPEQVLANAFQISLEEARRIKFNVQETTLTTTRSSSERRDDA